MLLPFAQFLAGMSQGFCCPSWKWRTNRPQPAVLARPTASG